jgi:hypothetical protein
MHNAHLKSFPVDFASPMASSSDVPDSDPRHSDSSSGIFRHLRGVSLLWSLTVGKLRL